MFPAGVQAYGSFCSRLSLTVFGDCQEIHDWSDNEKGVGFDLCKYLKMTRHSQINPKSHLKSWSLTLLGDCLDIHNWSDYKEKDVGFNMCKIFTI